MRRNVFLIWHFMSCISCLGFLSHFKTSLLHTTVGLLQKFLSRSNPFFPPPPKTAISSLWAVLKGVQGYFHEWLFLIEGKICHELAWKYILQETLQLTCIKGKKCKRFCGKLHFFRLNLFVLVNFLQVPCIFSANVICNSRVISG